MEHVLNGHAPLALGLLALIGGITGLKVGFWALGICYLICASGLLTSWAWENRAWLGVARKEAYAAMTFVPAALLVVVQQKVTRMKQY